MGEIKPKNKDYSKLASFCSFALLIAINFFSFKKIVSPFFNNVQYLPYNQYFPFVYIDKPVHFDLPILFDYYCVKPNFIFIFWILTYVVLVNFRILMGIIFVFNDDSANDDVEYEKSLNSKEEKDAFKERLKIENAWEIILVVILTFISLLLNAILWHLNWKIIFSLLFLLHIFTFVFNYIFRHKLFKRDKEKKANWFIFIGDVGAFLCFITLLIHYFVDSRLFYFLFGGFFLVFVGEYITQYHMSLRKALKFVFKVLKDNYIVIINHHKKTS